MKLKILNYGIAATHDALTEIKSALDLTSLADFDAFVFDPDMFEREVFKLSSSVDQGVFRIARPDMSYDYWAAIKRRRNEVDELFKRRGGVVLCVLRGKETRLEAVVHGNLYPFSNLAWLEGVQELNPLMRSLVPGRGKTIVLTQNAGNVGNTYLRVLKEHLQFEAHVGVWPGYQNLVTTLAIDPIGNPVAVQVRCGRGLACFVPFPQNATGERVGAAIVQTVRDFMAESGEFEAPEWGSTVDVPGGKQFDGEIANRREAYAKLAEEIKALEDKQQSLLGYRKLLFGYGKKELEPAVRAAFRLIGFGVPEPDEYEQEWDALLKKENETVAICEIQGSEGAIEIDKCRQLLDYIQTQAAEGRRYKGILAGNGFRLLPPDVEERKTQFTEKAMNVGQFNNFCLLPTTELFKAVSAVLEDPSNAGLKNEIRESMLNTVGVWTFSRAQSP